MRRLAIGLALPFVMLLCGRLDGAVITVDDSGGSDYDTIQPAIDHAVFGDTVRVLAGYYPGRIFMKNGVALLGSGPDVTVIDNAGAQHSTINFTPGFFGRTSRISGFTIKGALEPGPWMAGVWVGPDCSAEVSYNLITGCRVGIDIKNNVGDPLIDHNTIVYNSDVGIMLYFTTAVAQLRNNIIAHDGWGGIYLENSVYPGIAYNCLYDNGCDYIGVGPGLHDKQTNPRFCSPPADLRLQETSPCSGTGENGTNRGAYPTGCGVTAVLPCTWTSIKALYR
jgi:parallel beta-helix repeat protein